MKNAFSEANTTSHANAKDAPTPAAGPCTTATTGCGSDADRQRATVQVKVSILDRDPRILPEMGARVDFLATDTVHQTASAPRIRVPAPAVRMEDGKTVVWLVRDEKLERREVDAGPVSGGFREIRTGLSGGELLLVGGVDAPKAGMRVKPKGP